MATQGPTNHHTIAEEMPKGTQASQLIMLKLAFGPDALIARDH